MSSTKKIPEELQEVMENINRTCIAIANRDKLDIKFNKLDFLEKKGFYDKYDPNLFNFFPFNTNNCYFFFISNRIINHFF